MDTEERAAIFRLAQFNPNYIDDYGNQVLDYLVMQALATHGPLLSVSVSEIKDTVNKIFRLDFHDTEIQTSLQRLRKRGLVEGGEHRVKILSNVEQAITQNLTELQDLETEVLSEWKDEILDKYGEYRVIQDNIDDLVDYLQRFTSRMLLAHGIECVALLYPEAQKTRQFLQRIEGDIFEALPRIEPFVEAVAKLEIPSFFTRANSNRRAYITGVVNSSFYWHLIQVDEKCSKLLQQLIEGQQLYLDNNILWGLVGLDGPIILESVSRLLQFARELKYDLWVTTKTIDEFHESLRHRKNVLKENTPFPPELASIAAERLAVDDEVTVYWREYARTRISIEEFLALKSHLEVFLDKFHIRTTNHFREEIEESEELRDEESILRTVKPADSHFIIEHDAYHRVFITKLRGGHKYHFRDAVAWFLTGDTRLLVYDRVARRGRDCLPFCITMSQWLQINRPLLVRTTSKEEYEESFHTLVTGPFLRAMVSTISMKDAYRTVLSMVTRYKGMTPELAASLTADAHFMVSIASEDDEQRVTEMIENKLVNLADELRLQKEHFQMQVNDDTTIISSLKVNLQTLQEEFDSSKDEQTSMKERVRELGTDLQEINTQLASAQQTAVTMGKDLAAVEKQKKAAEQDSQAAHQALQTFKSNMKKWSLFVLLFVPLTIAIWTHSSWLDWAWFDGHNKQVPLLIGAQAILLLMLLNIPLRKHWQLWLGVIVAFVVTLLTLLI